MHAIYYDGNAIDASKERVMSKTITHDGVVIKTEGSNVHVQIVSHSACAGCHARGACTASDSKEKVIIAQSGGVEYSIGDRVTIIGSNSAAWYAVRLAFIYPILLAFIVLAGILVLTQSEVVACLGCLGVIAVYYLVLFLLRNKIETKFVFTLRKQADI